MMPTAKESRKKVNDNKNKERQIEIETYLKFIEKTIKEAIEKNKNQVCLIMPEKDINDIVPTLTNLGYETEIENKSVLWIKW